MSDGIDDKLDNCGCCGEFEPEAERYNRPGLDEIEYRIGRYGNFLTAMLERLPKESIAEEGSSLIRRPLYHLATRASDDPIIAILDSWACSLDVLSFYSERGVNEAFLRTATERRSVLELARAIGYELKPGVAASAYLQLTVEDRDDPFRTATVAEGTQVMSVPIDGGLPQIFETMAEIEARAEWNAMQARLGLSQHLAIYKATGEDTNNGKLYLLDMDGSLDLQAGDDDVITINDANKANLHLLNTSLSLSDYLADSSSGNIFALAVQQIFLAGISHRINVNDYMVLVGENSDAETYAVPYTVDSVSVESEKGYTRIELNITGVAKKKTTFSMPSLSAGKLTASTLSFSASSVAGAVLGSVWSQSSFGVMMSINNWQGKDLKLLLKKQFAQPALGKAENGIFILRQKVGFFGHNAPFYESVTVPEDSTLPTVYPTNWDDVNGAGAGTEPISIWKDPNHSTPPDYSPHDVYLERDVEGITPDSWAVFIKSNSTSPTVYRVSQVDTESRTGFALSGKLTGLTLESPSGGSLTKHESLKFRNTSAYVQSERLGVGELPVPDVVYKDETELMLNELVLDLTVGQSVVVSGDRHDAPGVTGTELKVLKEIAHYGGFTVLEFESGFEYDYLRKSMQVNANVVLATHGESLEQPLGNGDAAQANQQFKLNKTPLTYVSSSSASGTDSSLLVRVNDIQWDETTSLHDKTGSDKDYLVRLDDDGVPHIIFGDGERGARLPTGEMNITASYRAGIGVEGEVAENTLTLLKTRPLGVAAVTNPLAASGAEDPEQLDSARQNAPLTVRTLDRVVSLSDYADYANAFAGIGKAQAVAIWDGEAHLVYLTVASSSGKTITHTDAVYNNLLDSIQQARDPSVDLILAGYGKPSFKQLYFNLSASVAIDSHYIAENVLEDMRQALLDFFSFDKRAFGQVVTSAEVLALMQAIEGVIYIDLDKLYIVDGSGVGTESLLSVLPCRSARWNSIAKSVDDSELLLINQAGISLTEAGSE